MRVVLLYPDLVNYSFVRYLQRMKFKIIEVPPEEYWDLAVNGITLEAGKVIMNKGSPKTTKALEKEGIEVIQVYFSESQKFAIAGLHCATLELLRDQPGPLLEEVAPKRSEHQRQIPVGSRRASGDGHRR